MRRLRALSCSSSSKSLPVLLRRRRVWVWGGRSGMVSVTTMLDVMTKILTSSAPYAAAMRLRVSSTRNHFGPAVLQRFPHFDEDAEKLTDLCFAHKNHPSLWAGERPTRYPSIIAQNGPKGKPCGKKCTAEQTL